MTPTLKQDFQALLLEIEDPEEAELLRRLMEITTRISWSPTGTLEYQPFVYPH